MSFLLYKKSYIYYELFFLKSAEVCVHIYPDLKVIVYAPYKTPLSVINNRIRSKLNYIFKKYSKIKEALPKPPYLQVIEGQKHLYIGKRYNTHILLKQPLNKICFKSGKMIIHTNNSSNIKCFISEWYKKKAHIKFNERLKKCMLKSGLFYNALKIVAKYSKKFSIKCNLTKLFFINVFLLKAPIYIIDYVIYHALCHTKIFTHSYSFHILLNKILPPTTSRYFKITI